MNKVDQACQSCLVKLVEAQVVVEVVRSREEGTDFAAAGTASDPGQAGKVAMQAIDRGTLLGCRGQMKKTMYPWYSGAGE